MNLSLRPHYKQILAVIVLIIIVTVLILNSFKTWLAYSYAQGPQPQGLRLASETEPKNPDYYFLIAYYLMEYDYQSSYDTAMDEYNKALTLSPFNHNYWFYLAELLYDGGQREKALYALKQATELSPSTTSLRWRAGMLASKIGDKESVLDNLSAVIKYDASRRSKAFSLLWLSIGDGERIFENISDNALTHYFYFLKRTNRTDEAGPVFEKLKDLNYDTSVIAHKYASDLINKGNIDAAIEVWTEAYGGWEGVWNGSFDQNILNDGFDWRLWIPDGAKLKRDMDSYNGKYSFMVDFDGKHNLDFRHLYQIIPVSEDTDYKITMYIKSDDLLSSEDLRWDVYCEESYIEIARSEAISGTHDWEPIEMSFKTPGGCEAIDLRLKRDKSNRANSIISGTIWVDDVSIEKINQEPM